jgi:hypothetical protein
MSSAEYTAIFMPAIASVTVLLPIFAGLSEGSRPMRKSRRRTLPSLRAKRSNPELSKDGSLRRGAPLRKRFAFVAGDDGHSKYVLPLRPALPRIGLQSCRLLADSFVLLADVWARSQSARRSRTTPVCQCQVHNLKGEIARGDEALSIKNQAHLPQK